MTIFADPIIDQLCLEAGTAFHIEFLTKLGEDPASLFDAPEDLTTLIGQTLHIALDFHAPALAVDLYNRWAVPREHDALTYLGTITAPNGTQMLMLQVGTVAIVQVDAAYHIQDLHDLRPRPKAVAA